MKSTVFAILALSSAKVSSVSSCLGTSTPARRATAPLAVSQAICTWRFIGNMSGKSRQWVKTVGSIFFASAWAWALSRIAERFLSALTKRGVLAWYMEMIMGLPELRNGRASYQPRRVSSVQAAVRNVLARELGKVQVDTQHLLRPVGGLESEREGHAEFRAGDRQIGPRDLDISRSLDRTAEVRPGLPVRPLGGLHQLEAGIVEIHVALRVHVGADLQSVAADQIAALGAGELQQPLHRRLEFSAEGEVLHRILERGQVRHEPGVLTLLEFGEIRAVTCDQAGEHVAARVLRRQYFACGCEIIALHQVGIGVDRAKRLGLGLYSFHAYEGACLAQD